MQRPAADIDHTEHLMDIDFELYEDGRQRAPAFWDIYNSRTLLRTKVGQQQYAVVGRYVDASAVLAEPTGRVCPAKNPVAGPPAGSATALLCNNALSMMDPPRHTQVRRIAARAFTPRRAEALRPAIRECVQSVLDGVEIGEPIEISNGVAVTIPMKVICQLLGIAEQDWPDLQAWTEKFLPVFLPGERSPEQQAEIEWASRNFVDFFGRLLSERRRQPGDDLVSALLAAEVDGERLQEASLIGLLRGLLTAGFETTASTISAAFFKLDAAQRAALRANSALLPAAVEEVLRWETPVRMQVRHTTRTLQLSNGEVAPGSGVIVMLHAANRDPDTFASPDNLDIFRAGPAHLSFGAGRHFCLGAYLARVELQETLRFIVTRWIDWEICTEPAPTRRASPQFPALVNLTVSVGNHRPAP